MAEKKKVPKYGYNFARTHNPTQFDILELAVDLRRKVAKYIMNEKYVPKKWRYFDGKPAVDYARAVRDYVSCANDIRIGRDADDPDKVKERLRMEEKALSACNLLQFQLMDIIEDCEGATDENMTEITDDLGKLVRMIKTWNKTDNDRSGI